MRSKDRDNESKDLPPNQRHIDHILRWGEEHPGITFSIPKIDLGSWILTIDGEVEKPLKLDWSGLLRYPKVTSVSNFHCVEGWSVLDCKWQGIRFKDIVNSVKPKEIAKFVTFECADGYTTSFSLQDLLGDNILLAYRLNDKDLEGSLGGPLRLVFPSKYAYKSAMWITRITFASKKELGYWERRGYSDTADVWKNDRFSR